MNLIYDTIYEYCTSPLTLINMSICI